MRYYMYRFVCFLISTCVFLAVISRAQDGGGGYDEVELAYDDYREDNPPNLGLQFQGTIFKDYFITWFTSPSYPAQIRRVNYFLTDTTRGTRFRLFLWMYSNGQAGKEILPDTHVTGGIPGWNTIDLTGEALVTEEDFFVMLVYDGDSLSLGAENREPWSNRTFDPDCCGWEPIDNIDLLIRAVVGVQREGKDAAGPSDFAVKQNYPNPFNTRTTVEYGIELDGVYRFFVFDINGREWFSKDLWHGSPGSYSVSWDGKNLQGGEAPTGTYYYCLKDKSGMRRTGKMLLIR